MQTPLAVADATFVDPSQPIKASSSSSSSGARRLRGRRRVHALPCLLTAIRFPCYSNRHCSLHCACTVPPCTAPSCTAGGADLAGGPGAAGGRVHAAARQPDLPRGLRPGRGDARGACAGVCGRVCGCGGRGWASLVGVWGSLAACLLGERILSSLPHLPPSPPAPTHPHSPLHPLPLCHNNRPAAT